MTAATEHDHDKPQADPRLLALPDRLHRQTNQALQDAVLDWLLCEASVAPPPADHRLTMWNRLPGKTRTMVIERFRKAHFHVYNEYAEVLFALTRSGRSLRTVPEHEAAVAVLARGHFTEWATTTSAAGLAELLDGVYSKVSQEDLPPELAEVRTEEDFMVAVRSLFKRSGLSVRKIEKSMRDNAGKAARSKSTIDDILRRSTMPTDPAVLQALLTALVAATDEPSFLVDQYMKVRNKLVQQVKPAPDVVPEPRPSEDVEADRASSAVGVSATAAAEAEIVQDAGPPRWTWVQRVPPQLCLVVFTVGVLALLAALALVLVG